ncbi:MAG: recombination protein RecR [Phycisphaerales bacterium]|nr:MAG: recombination protein RecR [Phycisphaerales bacterium]
MKTPTDNATPSPPEPPAPPDSPAPDATPATRGAARAPRSASSSSNFGNDGGGGGGAGGGVYPRSVDRLIAAFTKLPGVGRRSAERLAFWVLKSSAEEAMSLADAIADVKRSVRHCGVCFNLTERDPCPICADHRRDHGLVLVIEQPKDLIALEQTGMHKGVYHVLLGRLSPLDGVSPEHLTIADLLARVDDPARNASGAPVREVILGLNPNLEGDGTALYLADQLRRRGVRVSRLARGLPSGSQLEYASKAVLADAIAGRQHMD